MNSPRLLKDLLADARRQLDQRRPDSAQDAAVLSRLRPLLKAEPELQLNGGGSLALRRAAWGGAGLGGAALLLALGLLLVEPPRLPSALPAHDSGFLPVVSAAEWQRAMADYSGSGEGAVLLMPAELPQERLALLGLPYDPARAAEPRRAELMLNPDGQLLAVRFLE